MLLPVPTFENEVPGPYAISRRPLMLGILVAQSLACLLRLVLLLDVMGGFIMAIGIGFGWYAYREMKMSCVYYWGLLSLINGAFDLVKVIDHWVKSPLPPFSSKQSAAYNIVSGLLLAIPLVTLAGAWLAYKMYRGQEEGPSGGYWAREAPPQRTSGVGPVGA